MCAKLPIFMSRSPIKVLVSIGGDISLEKQKLYSSDANPGDLNWLAWYLENEAWTQKTGSIDVLEMHFCPRQPKLGTLANFKGGQISMWGGGGTPHTHPGSGLYYRFKNEDMSKFFALSFAFLEPIVHCGIKS